MCVVGRQRVWVVGGSGEERARAAVSEHWNDWVSMRGRWGEILKCQIEKLAPTQWVIRNLSCALSGEMVRVEVPH